MSTGNLPTRKPLGDRQWFLHWYEIAPEPLQVHLREFGGPDADQAIQGKTIAEIADYAVAIGMVVAQFESRPVAVPARHEGQSMVDYVLKGHAQGTLDGIADEVMLPRNFAVTPVPLAPVDPPAVGALADPDDQPEPSLEVVDVDLTEGDGA